MHYLLLIHADESGMGDAPPEAVAEIISAVDKFDTAITENGQNLGSIRLQPSNTATVVRVRDGKTMITDGPFAETKEQLGGIYIISANDLDEAINIASRLPTAAFCTIEVRPLMGVDLKGAFQEYQA